MPALVVLLAGAPGALVSVLIAVLLAGVAVWAVGQMPGIDATFKQIFKVIVVVAVVVWAIYVLLPLVR